MALRLAAIAAPVRRWMARHAWVAPVGLTLLFLLVNAWKTGLFNHHLADPEHSYPAGVVRLLYLNAFVATALIYLLALRFKRPFVFAGLYLLQALYVLVNLLYFSYFQSYLHLGQAVGLWRETLELAGFGGLPFDPLCLVALADLPLAVLLAWRYAGLTAAWRRPPLRFAVYLPCLLALVWFGRENIAGEGGSLLQLADDQYVSEREVVKKHGLLALNVLDLLRAGHTERLVERLTSGVPLSSPGDSSAPRPSFVCIQVESMDAFAVQKKHRGEWVMPWLHSLAKRSVYYPYTLTYHLAGSTSDCEFSIINSAPALDDFPSVKVPAVAYPNAFAAQLAAAGYDVAMFHGNEGAYFNRTSVFRKMGFPRFYDMRSMGLTHVGWGAPDHAVLDFMRTRIDSATGPLCYYFISMSSHEPFSFVDNYYHTRRFSDIFDERTQRYFTCLSYVDSVLQAFVTGLRRDRPDTYVLIYGDHVPGVRSRAFRQAVTWLEGVKMEFVPLYIITPDGRKRRERSAAASLLDIAPTVLAASGAPYRIVSYGQDLLADSLTAAIPFRGRMYPRRQLYRLIDAVDR